MSNWIAGTKHNWQSSRDGDVEIIEDETGLYGIGYESKNPDEIGYIKQTKEN